MEELTFEQVLKLDLILLELEDEIFYEEEQSE